MRSPLTLFMAAVFFLCLGIGLLAARWNGTFGFSAAYPISNSTLTFSGSAHGGWAVGGMASLVLGLILLIVSVIAALVRRFKHESTTTD